MKSITVTELRANFTTIIDQVKKGKSFLITFHGEPLAKLIPIPDQRIEAKAKLKALRKTAIIGDVVSPIGEIWESN